MDKVLLGNDINVIWDINDLDLTSKELSVFVISPVGKLRIASPTITTTNISFILNESIQVLGIIRIEAYYKISNINKRQVVNNVVEFVDNPENVTNQISLIDTINIKTTGIKSVITYS